jgi:hypothetical protein
MPLNRNKTSVISTFQKALPLLRLAIRRHGVLNFIKVRENLHIGNFKVTFAQNYLIWKKFGR